MYLARCLQRSAPKKLCFSFLTSHSSLDLPYVSKGDTNKAVREGGADTRLGGVVTNL